MPKRASPPTTPPTMPPIAPPDNPESLFSTTLDVTDGVATGAPVLLLNTNVLEAVDDEVAVVDVAAVVDVSFCRASKLTGYDEAEG